MVVTLPKGYEIEILVAEKDVEQPMNYLVKTSFDTYMKPVIKGLKYVSD